MTASSGSHSCGSHASVSSHTSPRSHTRPMDSTVPSSAMTDAKAPPNRESVDGITPVMARGPMDSGADAAAASSSVRLLSISDALVAKLRETLGGLDAPWKPSLLYSPQVGQKFLDTEQRSSTFRAQLAASTRSRGMTPTPTLVSSFWAAAP